MYQVCSEVCSLHPLRSVHSVSQSLFGTFSSCIKMRASAHCWSDLNLKFNSAFKYKVSFGGVANNVNCECWVNDTIIAHIEVKLELVNVKQPSVMFKYEHCDLPKLVTSTLQFERTGGASSEGSLGGLLPSWNIFKRVSWSKKTLFESQCKYRIM